MQCLDDNKDGEQFELVDMETLLQNVIKKFTVEEFTETDCSTARKTSVCGEKMRIGDDNVGWHY